MKKYHETLFQRVTVIKFTRDTTGYSKILDFGDFPYERSYHTTSLGTALVLSLFDQPQVTKSYIPRSSNTLSPLRSVVIPPSQSRRPGVKISFYSPTNTFPSSL